jgi:hypothetical protein
VGDTSMDSAARERGSFTIVLRNFGVGKLVLITLCALGGTVAGNAIYNSMAKPRSADALMDKTRPSASYLTAMWSPSIDYARVEQAPFDFYEADEASIPKLLTKADHCWKAYDATPSWSQYDYCVAYDKVLRSYASPVQIIAHAKQSGYPSATDRKTMNFLVGESAALKGQHVAMQRASHVLMAIRIDNR